MTWFIATGIACWAAFILGYWRGLQPNLLYHRERMKRWRALCKARDYRQELNAYKQGS